MTPQQHEERRKRLHSTDVSAILGIDPFRTDWEVWAEKTGRLEPWQGNKSTKAGQAFEPLVLDYAQDDLGCRLERSIVMQAPESDLIASTLDARVPGGPPVEAKTTGLVGPVYGYWGDQDTDEVPECYLVQVTIQMMCARSEMAYLYALIGGRGYARYQIHRDGRVIDAVVETCQAWWNKHVVEGVEPDRTQPVPLDVVKRLRREPGKVINFDEETDILVEEWLDAKDMAGGLKKECKAMEAEIIRRLGDAEAANLMDGRQFTYLEQTRRPYIVEEESKFRVSRVRKAQ